MAVPVHAEIVGIRTSETGSDGYYVNSTQYSVLVYYSDSHVELVEGNAASIRPYLHLISPGCNMAGLEKVQKEIIESVVSENQKMKAEIRELHKEFDRIHSEFSQTQGVLKDIAVLMQPVPDIVGKGRQEAAHILNNKNLVYQEEDRISERITGTVIRAERDRDKYSVIHAKVRYDVPDVIGMDVEEAKRLLKNLGFLYTVKSVSCPDGSGGNKILKTEYCDGAKVILEVALSETDAFLMDLAAASSVAGIMQSWEKHNLAVSHPKTSVLIEEHAGVEKQYGVSMNIGIIKLEIKRSFEGEG